ncbi:MAG: magnesium/cobalt transporter CorA [Saprospiraceae bacterium]|nr:magnesium/cobalt transporter CorA [Saprospiraceae bacterium]
MRRRKYKPQQRQKVGLSPGSLILEREKLVENSVIVGTLYGQDHLKKGDLNTLTKSWREGEDKLWVDVKGIHDSDLLKSLGQEFGIDALALEDIQEVHQRTKINLYENGVFVLMKNVDFNSETDELKKEQVAFFVTDRLLISFQENSEESFPLIQVRMEVNRSRMRQSNTDYLLYAFMDYQIDKYFVALDEISNSLSKIEEIIYQKKHEDVSLEVFNLRNILLQIRRYINPLRDDLTKLVRSESPLIAEQNIKYIKDLEDHIVQIIEMIDNQRELLNGLRDISINQTSLSLNKDMKWLAAISTISIPILFLTGVYGMNFESMQELKWEYGYLIWWISTSVIVISLIIYFKRRKMI